MNEGEVEEKWEGKHKGVLEYVERMLKNEGSELRKIEIDMFTRHVMQWKKSVSSLFFGEGGGENNSLFTPNNTAD